MADNCGTSSDAGEVLMTPKKRFDRGRTCVKCKDRDGSLVIGHAVYCSDCFIPITTTKFRRALEPHINPTPDGPRKKALKPAGNLVLAFSGGIGSGVLLDLVHKVYLSGPADTADGEMRGGRDHPRNDPTRVWKRVVVVYVEQASAYEGVKDQTDEVAAIVSTRPGFELVPVKLEDAFDASWWFKVTGASGHVDYATSTTNESLPVESHSSDKSPLDLLRLHLTALPTPTAVATRIQDLTRLLILYTARSVNASHMLLGTCLTSLSISLMSNIATGGGFNLANTIQETWFSDAPSTNPDGVKPHSIRIIRPLRDVVAKELGYWAHMHALPILTRTSTPPLTVGTPSASGNPKSRIDGLISSFVGALDRDYPSTVSAIARTCAKVGPKGEAGPSCVLCERPMQKGVEEWKARTAIRRLVPKVHDAESEHDAEGVRDHEVVADGTERGQKGLMMAPMVCYMCHTALTSRGAKHGGQESVLPLPVWTSDRLARGGGMTLNQRLVGQAEGEVVDQDSVSEEIWVQRKMGEDDMKSRLGGLLLSDD